VATPATELSLLERYQAGKAGLMSLLADLEDSGSCRLSVYLVPSAASSSGEATSLVPEAALGLTSELEHVKRQVGDSDTGLAVFILEDRTVAIMPPFPVRREYVSQGADTAQMVEILGRDVVVGVLLLRLGHYAVGVLRGGALVASKSGSRYVKSRHRAGGSSQRRFERSRERLVRELFDRVCREAQGVFAPFGDGIDYLLMGGERHTLKAFVGRCALAQRLAPITLRRTLAVDRPGKKALEQIPYEVWKGSVFVFARSDVG